VKWTDPKSLPIAASGFRRFWRLKVDFIEEFRLKYILEFRLKISAFELETARRILSPTVLFFRIVFFKTISKDLHILRYQ